MITGWLGGSDTIIALCVCVFVCVSEKNSKGAHVLALGVYRSAYKRHCATARRDGVVVVAGRRGSVSARLTENRRGKVNTRDG